MSIEGPLENESQQRAEQLLDSITVSLGTSLNLPDEDVIKQDQTPDEEEIAMYFVGSGSCRVMVRDQNSREQ